MATVKLTNTSPKSGGTTFVDKWGGTEYVIRPGETLIIDEKIANHWLGDPNILGGSDENAKVAEELRVKSRRPEGEDLSYIRRTKVKSK